MTKKQLANAYSCGCSHEHGPCKKHCEILAQRERPPVNSQLMRLFIDDLVDHQLVALGREEQKMLDEADEILKRWFDDIDVMESLYDLCDAIISRTPSKVWARCEIDRYLIARMNIHCPLIGSPDKQSKPSVTTY